MAHAADMDCSDFSTQADAQSYFVSLGGPSSDPDLLDGDGDGVACELNPCPCSGSDPRDTTSTLSFYAVITAVTDGDTIKVRRGFSKRYTVRLIGIDTPETKKPGTPVECGGLEATSNMHRLSFKGGTGRRVKVTTDPTQDRRDRYGRLLAYVKSARGSLAGAQLRAGWAAVYVFADPFAQLGSFRAAEATARTQGRGAWGQCNGNFHQPD